MAEIFLDKKRVITDLTKAEHGNLSAYLPIASRAATDDPNFFAHLVAWNHSKGQVRDAKVALPVIALAETSKRLISSPNDPVVLEQMENALAHIADLNLRMLRRVFLATTRREKIGKVVTTTEVPPFYATAGAPIRVSRRLLTRYLRNLEANRGRFERTAVQHRATLRRLYTRHHIPRPEWVGQILFHGEKGQPRVHAPGVFDIIRRLGTMSPVESAGLIVKFSIPFIVARGALGKKIEDPDLLMALIKQMSPTELVTNMKQLESLGVNNNPALRAALAESLDRASSAKGATRSVVLKATRAAEALTTEDGEESVLTNKLRQLQEKQIEQTMSIEGDWAVFADKSGSMAASIQVAAEVSGILSRVVKGKIYLVFFDGDPYFHDVTGKSLEEIKAICSRYRAGGGTNMGAPLRALKERKLVVEGIAYIGDGGDQYSRAPEAYREYTKAMDVDPTVYFYRLPGDPNFFSSSMSSAGIEVQQFDLANVDYTSLPNLVQTMRVNRYSLLDEIMATPLHTLNEVLDKTTGMPVLASTIQYRPV